MGRFKKFINSEAPKPVQKKKEKSGNVFKRRRRKKNVYKSKVNKEDFLKKMEAKGATIGSYSIMDAINSKNQKIKQSYDVKKTKKTEKIKMEELEDDSTEAEKEAMRNFVLSRYYEEQVEEEEEEEVFTQQALNNNNKDDIISF